jgi:hypothetical protein
MTLYSSVFASPSRLRLAHEGRANNSTAQYYWQLAAGKYSTVATLEAARGLGMVFTHDTMNGAARCNTLSVIQFYMQKAALEAAAEWSQMEL